MHMNIVPACLYVHRVHAGSRQRSGEGIDTPPPELQLHMSCTAFWVLGPESWSSCKSNKYSATEPLLQHQDYWLPCLPILMLLAWIRANSFHDVRGEGERDTGEGGILWQIRITETLGAPWAGPLSPVSELLCRGKALWSLTHLWDPKENYVSH